TPSNVEEGYLARLLIRRCLRTLKLLGLEGRLPEIMSLQIDKWSRDFPRLREMRSEILEMLSVEGEKYERTIKRGSEVVQRIVQELKAEGLDTMPEETLIELYDSHGIVPEIVSELAPEIRVRVPDNFFSMVAQRHISTRPKEETPLAQRLSERVSHVPSTRLLYYEDEKLMRFKSRVVEIIDNLVALDQTCFYPEGGGQVADTGLLKFNGNTANVVDVQKVGGVVLHALEGPIPQLGSEVEGVVDKDRRMSLMRHHTATHILIGAARRVLGEHAWQAGARKEADKSRLDISHFRHLTSKEVEEIERMAIRTVTDDLPVEVAWMPRQEAEKKFGYRIYQGGAVPGREIRIVNIAGWDVEACGGTHCSRTGEVGIIKILKVERPQDGVERLIFATGEQALRYIQEKEAILGQISELVDAPLDKLTETLSGIISREREYRRIVERSRQESVDQEAAEASKASKPVDGVKIVLVKKQAGDDKTMILLSSRIAEADPSAVAIVAVKEPSARIFVSAGARARERGVHAGRLSSELAKIVGGGGGGKPYFGQGGGTEVDRLDEALQKAEEYVKRQLSK
ncbi:MAG: alanine--tRNA ligase-related protein, partial [Candidatus Bathyarchaeia archaeon]